MSSDSAAGTSPVVECENTLFQKLMQNLSCYAPYILAILVIIVGVAYYYLSKKDPDGNSPLSGILKKSNTEVDINEKKTP